MGFLSIILLLVLYGTLLDDFLGQLLSLVIIVNSGVDSAVGLALLINLYKKKGSIRFEALSLIRK
jgi:NADH:ubiquinone oxidoreductase subunit K